MRSWIIALHVLSINLKLWNSADKDGLQIETNNITRVMAHD